MAKIVTLGEIMLRLSPKGYNRFVQSDEFAVTYGGGEANVALSLAQLKHQAYFVSKVPNNNIGQSAINQLRQYGVMTDHVLRGGERIGIYFLETGASMRPSNVIYDRSNSAIAMAKSEEFDFDTIFNDADWFHFTGITPALSKECSRIIQIACKKAKEHNVIISVDLNYRKKLWTKKEAQVTMRPLMKYVDVCIGNEEDMHSVLGYDLKHTDITKGNLDISSYKNMFKKMMKDFDFKYIVSTLRKSYSASDNNWSSIAYDGKTFYQSRTYDIRIVDRVGGGDSFAAGLIHKLLEEDDIVVALDFATAASALKQTINGDANLVNEEEVMKLVNGDSSGRVQR